MKHAVHHLTLVFFLVFGFVSCDLFEDDQKESVKVDEEDNTYLQVYADQSQNTVMSLWDQAVSQNLTGGRTASVTEVKTDSLTEVCGIKAFMDISKIRPVLTVNFGSFRCESAFVYRTGVVKLELLSGTSIDQQYSVSQFTFDDFRVTDYATGKYIVYNGTKVVTNLSGGVLTNLVFGQPELVHKVRSENFRIFYSGSSGDIIKNTSRKVKFSKLDIANNYRMITTADTTINGMANVADWGTLRNGTPYYHIIKKAIYYESCSAHCKYTRGERVQITEGGRETTTIFGVDQDGNRQYNCAAYGKLIYYFDAQGDSIATIVKYN